MSAEKVTVNVAENGTVAKPQRKARTRRPRSASKAAPNAVTVNVSEPKPKQQQQPKQQSSRKRRNRQRVSKGGGAGVQQGLLSHDDPRRIAMSLACPSASYTPRLADDFSDSPTAVGNPWARHNIQLGQFTPEEFFTEDNVLFAAMFRDPCRATIHSDNHIGGEAKYRAYGSSPGSLATLTTPATSWNIHFGSILTAYPIGLNYWKTYSGTQPHGPILCTGTATGKQDPLHFTWCDGLTIVSVNYTTAGEVDAASVLWRVWTWEENGPIEQYTVASDGGANKTATLKNQDTTEPTHTAGYYAFEVIDNGSAVFTTFTINYLEMTINAEDQVMCHRPLPAFEKWFASAQGIRIHAGSITLTNATAAINRAGQIVAYQAPVGTHWWDYAVDSSQISSAQGSAQIDSINGMYTWLSPASEEDDFYKDYYETRDGVLVDTHFPLMEQNQFLVMSYINNTTSETVFVGYWTFNFGIEFLSDDVSREVTEPAVSVEAFKKARQLVKKMPKYAENPTHWTELLKSIANGAKTAINWGVKNAPTLLKGVETISSLASLL